MSLGDAIRRRRVKHGWTQGELARRAEVSTSYISRLEKNYGEDPGVIRLGRIARALGASVVEILKDAGEVAHGQPAAA